ncbi:TPM domain-containing protein [uncultured Arcticibacterium sp.]|mgnify:CR=1 FL=1|uniref:TPM domain-containing protein n=1 Tax=uncultured Arcticibacterium sp. TaxID=2173042 RepID=UPI0030F74ED4
MINSQRKLKVFFNIRAVLLLLMTFALGVNLKAQDIPAAPKPARLVNDFVGALSSSEIQRLEQKLVNFDDTTSNQIAVVVVKTVEPYDINSYAVKLGREWGIGHDGKNNGIVVLWATDDRKVYIATGYGLEGGLPDAYAKRTVDRVIIPYFKESRFYEGLDKGTDAIIKYTSGEFDAEADAGGEFPVWAFFLMVVIIFIIVSAISKGGRGGGGMMRDGSAGQYTTYTGWGRHSGNWSGGGGFGGGFGGGGGGFGGFGGGSFGGGGAGGSY